MYIHNLRIPHTTESWTACFVCVLRRTYEELSTRHFVLPRSLSTAMPRTRTALLRSAIINHASHALSPSGAAWLVSYT